MAMVQNTSDGNLSSESVSRIINSAKNAKTTK